MQDLILDITQEECAELIMVCSKIKRFGIDASWDSHTNNDRLTQEMGDVMCMLRLLCSQYNITEDQLEEAAIAKLNKLKVWAPSISTDRDQL